MRTLRPHACLLVACALALAGCGDELPTDPQPSADGAVSPAASFEVTETSASDEFTDRHLVVFRGKKGIPGKFARSVGDLGGSVDLALESVGAAVVSGLDEDGASELAGNMNVQLVEPELAIAIPEPVTEPATARANLAAEPASPDDPESAFFFARQWNMRAIEADAAWAEGALGAPDVTVAILDTGIDYTHVDLEGLVDLDRSASFLPDDDALLELVFPGAHPVADLHFHGTHVAATVSSNALAAAGVTSRTTLIGAKVCSVFTGLCPTGAVFAGLEHAIENDADIVNMSLGGSFVKSEAPGFVSVIDRLFNTAKQEGTSIVVSSGNDGIDLDHNGNEFAAYCDAPHVICVSATGPTAAGSVDGPFEDVDAFAPYSNFGRSALTVAAPGGRAVSEDHGGGFVWSACSTFSLVVPGCQAGPFVVGLTGTSMASPHAAGVAALLAADGAGTPSRIDAGIRQTADDLGQPGTDPQFGTGRVNALEASR